ncbi:MAG: protein translocase subunit SecD [Alphaproteobacteria bacterium]|nr:protein translocase subunit SecD [Alphaproteobacteria bacterium]
MYKLSRNRILVIMAICLTGIFFALPNFLGGSVKLPQWWQPVNLGLDLQGGSSLLLKVQIDEVIKERMSLLEDSARQTLRDARIRPQSIRAGADSLKIKIDNLNARNKAMNLLKKGNEDYNIAENDSTIEMTYTEQALTNLKLKTIDQSIEVVRRRIDAAGTKEPSIQRQGSDQIAVQLPGEQNPEYIKSLLGKTAKLSFNLVDRSTTAAAARLSNKARVVSGQEGGTYVVTSKPVVTGEHLTDASATYSEGQPVVSFKFDTIGGKKFGEATSKHVNEALAIILDNEVISAPNINGPITGGSGIISGNFTIESANELAMLLRSGALPAPLEILEERTVGAGLGADSIKAGITASVIGLILVVLFMIAAYGLFGIFTTIAVFLNLFLMLGVLSLIGATLTLPGIAGVILTIGMAVDANVLIFERMREEVNHGRSTKDAAEAGFTEAWATIVDSNLTTLVAAFVLLYFGTGPVRGFAVTLAIGIATSMFTSVTVTRLIITGWIIKYKPTRLPI